MSYKKLADDGWTQQRIADAKDVSQKSVSRYLQLSELSENVLNKIRHNDFLNERCMLELLSLDTVSNLNSWISQEIAMLEVITNILNRISKTTTQTTKKRAWHTYQTLLF
jgi:predicted transcriptional regulator